jgi:hypothetical protein
MTVPYRDFYYPLNVFMHVLTLEEGGVEHLHYGLFEQANDPISVAQERSTALLLSRLPPARAGVSGAWAAAAAARCGPPSARAAEGRTSVPRPLPPAARLPPSRRRCQMKRVPTFGFATVCIDQSYPFSCV